VQNVFYKTPKASDAVSKIIRQSICRLLLIETTGNDTDLGTDHFQVLLFLARPAFHISASHPFTLKELHQTHFFLVKS
jgi:hypothetical protein